LYSSDAPWTRWALVAFSLIVAGALGLWVRRAEKRFTGLALGLIIGGALGNAVDRIRDGVVVDFLDVTALRFPWVFNVADSGVSIGAVLLVWDTFLAPRKRATP
jgi:signal peptidase II